VEEGLEEILADLREISHGLHPPLLSRVGLGPSLQALARRSPIPLQLDIDLPERPAEALETALYYVVSEALTNSIKHSHASGISVAISSDTKLRASIVDDGIGGADPGGGSGLTGLQDRVDALGGRFVVESPARVGHGSRSSSGRPRLTRATSRPSGAIRPDKSDPAASDSARRAATLIPISHVTEAMKKSRPTCRRCPCPGGHRARRIAAPLEKPKAFDAPTRAQP